MSEKLKEPVRSFADQVDSYIMRKFLLSNVRESIETIAHQSRKIKVIEVPFDFERKEISFIFIGHEMVIDGERVKIVGVNCYAIEKIKNGTSIELWVKGA